MALGAAYDVKLPTASSGSLGSGRVDHRLLSLVTATFRHFELDLTTQPAGVYASGGVTWQPDSLLSLDLGARIGLSAGAPSFGLTAGVSMSMLRP